MIGLIAGGGAFPALVVRAARRLGHPLAVAAIEGEASPALESVVRDAGAAPVTWLRLGQLGTLLTVFRDAGVTVAVMAGRVQHARIFRDLNPDATLAPVLARLTARNAEALIAAVAGVLGAHGITVMDSTALLPDLVARAGVLSARPPSDEMTGDFAFAYPVADALAGLDVGQTVVVKDRAVVAVEAMEGTDATIARAGALAGRLTRIVKVARPRQDMRFDAPVVGLSTLEAMTAAGADALSIDAGRTLVLDGPDFFRAADARGIVVVGRAQGAGAA